MAKTFRLNVEKLGGTAPEEFVGNSGELFYDPADGILRKSDGTTAGGAVVGGGGGAVDSVNGQTGVVSLDASDVGAADASHTHILSDITDAGTAAASDTEDFATAAQGSLADTAVQPADLDVLVEHSELEVLENVYHVHPNGSDLNPGTIAKPFQTIQAAAAAIGAATNSTEFNDPTQRFYRINVGPGVYTETITFGTRPHIILDLSSALVIGNVIQQYDQGGTFGGTFQATKLSIVGNDLRSYTTSVNPRMGVEGEVILESIGGGSSLFMILSLINTGVSSHVRKRLGTGGGLFTGQIFIENTNVGGQIINEGTGSVTLYAANSDTSSTQAIGGVTGAVNLNVIRNVRFNGPVVVNSAHGRWFNVEFKSGQAHDFTGSSGTISADANSFGSYFENVPTKGSETFNLLDRARGVKSDVTPTNYSTASVDIKAHLEGINTALGLRARRVTVPTTATDPGVVGDYAVDATYAYFCIATNTWVRQPVATW